MRLILVVTWLFLKGHGKILGNSNRFCWHPFVLGLFAVLMSSMSLAVICLFNLFSWMSLDYFEDNLIAVRKLIPLIWFEVSRALSRLRVTSDDYFLELIASNFLTVEK
jgi:hypothetical protein